MKKKNPKNETVTQMVKRRNAFIHGICVNPRYTIFNWTFWTSLVICIVIALINHLSGKQNMSSFFRNNMMDIFSVSISAIGIILAAIAIVVIIFPRKELSLFARNGEEIFEGFIFPYRFSATLWGIIAVSSILVQITNISISKGLSKFAEYVFIFILIYASMYPLNLIKEIIDNILFSSLTFKDKN